MRVRILSLARWDLWRGFEFYERQSRGIGWYFLESLSSDIESLRLYAGIHRRFFGYYRFLSKRFPFAIYYNIEREEIRIWRVLDCRRDSRWTKLQLSEARRTT